MSFIILKYFEVYLICECLVNLTKVVCLKGRGSFCQRNSSPRGFEPRRGLVELRKIADSGAIFLRRLPGDLSLLRASRRRRSKLRRRYAWKAGVRSAKEIRPQGDLNPCYRDENPVS